MLGVQYALLSPCKNYILVGERALTQEYCPGKTTMPGGMVEIKDVKSKPRIGLLRELKEEVSLPLESKMHLIAVIGGFNNVSVTFLIKIQLHNRLSFDPTNTIAGDKNEWNSDLRWISLSSLLDLPNNRLLDGLIYFKSIIHS